MIIVNWRGVRLFFVADNIFHAALVEPEEGDHEEAELVITPIGGGRAYVFGATDGDIEKLYGTFLSAIGHGKNIREFSGKEKA